MRTTFVILGVLAFLALILVVYFFMQIGGKGLLGGLPASPQATTSLGGRPNNPTPIDHFRQIPLTIKARPTGTNRILYKEGSDLASREPMIPPAALDKETSA